jgi:energy-coupling factor transport system ATP-binding protein
VSIDGISADYSSRKLRELRRKVGLVFQYPESQFFAETVRDEIQFAPSNWGVSGDDLRLCVDEAAAGAGINPSLLDSNPFALSGGQRRRVAIASVLAMRPDYLVLDEPTAGLDMSGVKDLTRMLNDLRGRGLAVIQVTHDLGGALANSDRILVLENGRVVVEGKPEEVAGYLAEHPARGLLLPETVLFARGLRNMGVDVSLISGAEEMAEILEKERARRGCV